MSEFIITLASSSDKAIDENNEDEIKRIIQIYCEEIEALNVLEDKSYGYYILGNLWSKLREIEHDKNINKVWNLEQKEVFKEIYYFRKAIQQSNFKDLDLSIQLATYVNLGNVFSHYGRTINAI